MPIKTISDQLRITYLQGLKELGDQGLYDYTIGQGSKMSASEVDSLLLDYSEAFFVLYRKSGEEEYFTLGKILRRAAHTLYRDKFKSNEDKIVNHRFLNLISVRAS